MPVLLWQPRDGEATASVTLSTDFVVKRLCATCRLCSEAWGLPCFTEHVQAAAYAAQNRLSTEDAARRLRYAALRRIAAQQGAVAIVTAHHEGDQAETLLLRLLRGAGLQGLAGMRAQQGDIIRC